MSEDIKTLKIIVSGVVQGVGFRAWTTHTARKLSLRGWVRNLKSGEVEMLISGSVPAVENMETLCWDGPVAASVSGVHATPTSNDGLEDNFRQLPTV